MTNDIPVRNNQRFDDMDKSDEHGFVPSSFGREKRVDVSIDRLQPRGNLTDTFLCGVSSHEEEDADNAAVLSSSGQLRDRATIAGKDRRMFQKTKVAVDRCRCYRTSRDLGYRTVGAAPNEVVRKSGSARRSHKQKTSSSVPSLPGVLREFIAILLIIVAPMTRSLCFILTCLLRLATFFTLTPFGTVEISGSTSTEWKASTLSKLPSNTRTKSETELLKIVRRFEDADVASDRTNLPRDAAEPQEQRKPGTRESHNSKKKFNLSLAMVNESRREDRIDIHNAARLSPQFQGFDTKPYEDSIVGNRCLKRLSRSKGHKHIASSQVAAAKNASVFTMQNCKPWKLDQSVSLDRRRNITSRYESSIFTDQVGMSEKNCDPLRELSSLKCQLSKAVQNFAAVPDKTKQPVVQAQGQISRFLVEEGINAEGTNNHCRSMLSMGEIQFPNLVTSRSEQVENMHTSSVGVTPTTVGKLLNEQKFSASCPASAPTNSVDASLGKSLSDSLAVLSKFTTLKKINARQGVVVDERSIGEKNSKVVNKTNSAACEGNEIPQHDSAVRIQPPAEGSFDRCETKTPKASHYTQPIDAKSKWLEMKKKFYGNDYGKIPQEPNQPKLEPSLSTAKLPANQIFQYNIAVARARQIGTEVPACDGQSRILTQESTRDLSNYDRLANCPSTSNNLSGSSLLQTRSLSQWPLEPLDPRQSRKYYPSPKPRTDRKVFKKIGNCHEDEKTVTGYANCSVSSSRLNLSSRPMSVDCTVTPRELQGVNRNEGKLVQLSDDEEKNGSSDDVFMERRDSRDIERRDIVVTTPKANSAVDEFLKSVNKDEPMTDEWANKLRSRDENLLYESCSEQSVANLSRSRNKNSYREVENLMDTTDGSLPWYSELFIEDNDGTVDN